MIILTSDDGELTFHIRVSHIAYYFRDGNYTALVMQNGIILKVKANPESIDDMIEEIG